MENELYAILAQYPKYIPRFLGSGYLENEKKWSIYYNVWSNTQKIISDTETLESMGVSSTDFTKKWNETDIELVFDELKEFNRLKFLSELNDIGSFEWEDVDTLKEKYQINIEEKKEESICISSIEDIDRVYKIYKETVEEKIDTGFSQLDTVFNGGWIRGAIYSVMGLSGYGKSIFLSNFARSSWFNNYNVLYISTEMRDAEVYERIFKSYTNKETFNEALLTLKKIGLPKGKLEVIKIHPYETSCSEIESMIDNLTFQPDIIYVDYADELLAEKRVNSEYDGQGVIYAGLKRIAEVYNVPVVTATQTNREAENKEGGGTKAYVGYSAIADSTKKIRLVHGLLSITQSPDEKEMGTINLQTLKNRSGENNNEIQFHINYKTMRLNDSIIKTIGESITEKRQMNKGLKGMMSDPKELNDKLKEEKSVRSLSFSNK